MPYDSEVPAKSKKRAPGAGAPIRVIRTGVAGQPTLLVSTTSQYDWLYNDQGSGANMDVTIWRPHPTDTSWFIIGDYAQGNYSTPTGVSIVVKAINDDPANPLLKLPADYREVWNDHGSGGDNDGSIWYPVPQDGYKPLGFAGQMGYDKPNISNFACVRQDLLTTTDAGVLIWNDQGSGADKDVSLYAIVDVENAFAAQADYDPFQGTVYKLKSS